MRAMTMGSLERLTAYVESQDYAGWDPYDGLNSRVFQTLWPANRIPVVRLAWIQWFKRSRVNLRRLLRVPEGTNPKAIALFVSGYCSRYRADGQLRDLETAIVLADRLLTLTSPGFDDACWGYNFDWQSLSDFKPAYLPTGVVTSFAGYALLDLYEISGETRFLEAAVSASRFMMRHLNRTVDETGDVCFSYSPQDRSTVYNASLLVSKLLARVYSITGTPETARLARSSVSYCSRRQTADGAWIYGTEGHHRWVDSFHTGFNLESIGEYQKHTGDSSFAAVLERGLQFYLETFFTADGVARYYRDATYPIDIHCIAQLISTMTSLQRVETHASLLSAVLAWALENMQDPSGYFYYQHGTTKTNTIPYMRWSQAWMFHSLSRLHAYTRS